MIVRPTTRAGLLALATILTVMAARALMPARVPEMKLLGDAAVNTSPAIRIQLAGKDAVAPPVTKTSPSQKRSRRPRKSPEKSPR